MQVKCVSGRGEFALAAAGSCPARLRAMADAADDREPLAGRRGRAAPEPRLPARGRRRVAAGVLGRGGRGGRRARERPARARRRRRATRSRSSRGRASSGRSSTSRWRSSEPSARRSTRRARRTTRSYLLEHSEAVGVLVEDDEQRAKVDGVGVAHVLSFADLDELRERGRALAARHPDALDERAASIDEDDLFTFIYTSGTTGPPKACMIRHRNYYAMVQKGDELEDRLTRPGDVMLLYLPLAHNYGRLLHLSARVHRVHDRVPGRSAARGDRAAARPADALPERAARLREDPHGGRRQVRRGDRRQAPRSSTGRSRSGARVGAAAGEAAGAARRSRCSTGSPTGSSTRR